MKVLITDGNCRSALAVTRSLGRKGIHVVVADECLNNLSSTSRFCSEKCAYPSPYTSPEAFIEAIHDIISTYHIDLLLPVSDVAIDNILGSEKTFSPHLLKALPTYNAYSAVSNKINLLRLAADIGIQIPEGTTVLNEHGFYENIDRIRYPVVVKPGKSRMLINGNYVATSVRYAASKDALVHLYRTTHYLKEPFLLQQIVCGPGFGLFSLFDNGNPVAFFSHMRIREKPPTGGVSVLCKSIPVDNDIRRKAELLLRNIGWNGVVMIEYKMDAHTGIPYLMEINGRFWGSLQLAIDAGMDFPCMLYKMATGKKDASCTHYEPGIMSRWLLGDVDHLYLSIFKKRYDANILNTTHGRWRAIGSFLKYNGRNCHFDVLRIDDISPFIMEVKQYITSLFGSGKLRQRT